MILIIWWYKSISLSTEIRAPAFVVNMRFMDAREVAARNMNELASHWRLIACLFCC